MALKCWRCVRYRLLEAALFLPCLLWAYVRMVMSVRITFDRETKTIVIRALTDLT